MGDIQLPPISALKALEPRPGGQWAIYEQEGDTISLSYVMNNGTEAITYTLYQCKTEEDIRKHCAGFVYEYTNDFDTGYGDRRVGELLPEFGNTREAASQIYQTHPLILPEQYSTSQNPQPLREQFLFNAPTVMISPPESQTQVSSQSEETTMTQQSQLYQEEQGYLASDDQQLLPGGLASGLSEWPLRNGYFPTATENNPISMPITEDRMSQDMSILMDSWQQSWASVNPDDAQGSEGGWDALLPLP